MSESASGSKPNWVCGVCLREDDVLSSVAHEDVLTHPEYGYRTKCVVCSRCKERGRDTRVTCRTWVSPDKLQRP